MVEVVLVKSGEVDVIEEHAFKLSHMYIFFFSKVCSSITATTPKPPLKKFLCNLSVLFATLVELLAGEPENISVQYKRNIWFVKKLIKLLELF